MMQSATVLIDPRDDVAVALTGLAAGDAIGGGVVATADIPVGHKIALRAIAAGSEVRKYGWPIGRATADIAAGDHVHGHNLETALSGQEAYAYSPVALPLVTADVALTFQGYRRANGRVGTRNEIWILCTVGCVARTAQRIAAEAARRWPGRVDGIHAFTHPLGCSQLGDDLAATRAIIGALAAHPNAGGVLVIGLGCESNQLATLLTMAPAIDPARLRAFTAQSFEDEMEEGLNAVEELITVAERDRRVPCPVSDLVIGLKCGGSDGFSGLSANPLVGRVADKVTAAGGTAVLTEIPEIFGAERLLMSRAANEAVFQDIATVVNDFKAYFLSHGEPVSENPSPGNIMGGVTTLEEKSLGAVQKAGRDSSLETGDTTVADEKVREQVEPVLPDVEISSERVSYFDFTDIGRAEAWNDANGDGSCDNGEAYTDENRNGDWDADIGANGNGGADDVVVYTVNATYTPVFRIPLLPHQWNERTLSSSTVRKNQPFADQAEYGSAAGVCS